MRYIYIHRPLVREIWISHKTKFFVLTVFSYEAIKPRWHLKKKMLCYYEQNIRWNIYKRNCRLYIKNKINICWVLLIDARHWGQNALFILVNYHKLTNSYFTKEAIENQVAKHWIRSRTKPLHNIVAIFSKLSRLLMYLLLFGSMCQYQNSLLK